MVTRANPGECCNRVVYRSGERSLPQVQGRQSIPPDRVAGQPAAFFEQAAVAPRHEQFRRVVQASQNWE